MRVLVEIDVGGVDGYRSVTLARLVAQTAPPPMIAPTGNYQPTLFCFSCMDSYMLSLNGARLSKSQSNNLQASLHLYSTVKPVL